MAPRDHDHPVLLEGEISVRPATADDLDTLAKWFVGNQDVDAALTYAGYEHQFVIGDEGHNAKHGGAILPDALRYVWKDYPRLPVKGTFPNASRDGRPSVINIVDPNEPWQLVGTTLFRSGAIVLAYVPTETPVGGSLT